MEFATFPMSLPVRFKISFLIPSAANPILSAISIPNLNLSFFFEVCSIASANSFSFKICCSACLKASLLNSTCLSNKSSCFSYSSDVKVPAFTCSHKASDIFLLSSSISSNINFLAPSISSPVSVSILISDTIVDISLLSDFI